MNKITCATFLIALTASLPAAAQTAARLSAEELLARATEQNVCGGSAPTAASYESASSNVVRVTCPRASATGEFGAGMGAGAAAIGGLIFVAALAGGGGNGTPSTN